jgi:hypothetical protein
MTTAAKPIKFKPAAAVPATGRLAALALGRAEVLKLDPRIISREPGFNQRVVFGDLDSLGDDLVENDVQSPLTVRKDGERILLVNGDRRLTAIELKMKKGEWPEDPDRPGFPRPVPCINEGQGVTATERMFKQLSLNNGKPFTSCPRTSPIPPACSRPPTSTMPRASSSPPAATCSPVPAATTRPTT